MSEIYHVSDPQALKAMTHPLRGRLLLILRIDGPATATELAAQVGESSGSTSYHLRRLARYGFIEEDPERRDARERRWRAVHRYSTWSDVELAATPDGRDAVAQVRRREIGLLLRNLESFEAGTWSEDWLRVAGIADDVVRLTPDSVAALRRRFGELLREHAARDEADPAAEQVFWHLSVFPWSRPR